MITAALLIVIMNSNFSHKQSIFYAHTTALNPCDVVEADKLQQLLIHSKTANILLGFSNHNQSTSGDLSDNKSNGADDKVCEGEQSAEKTDSDESSGRSHVSSSISVYQCSTESLTKDSDDESRGITKKRKASDTKYQEGEEHP